VECIGLVLLEPKYLEIKIHDPKSMSRGDPRIFAAVSEPVALVRCALVK